MGVPQGLLLHGPPDGVSRAAQNRRCGAAVDWPAAVAALSKMAENGQVKKKNTRKWPKKAKKPSILTVFEPFLDRRSATAMSSREAWAASALKKTKKHRILRDLEGAF